MIQLKVFVDLNEEEKRERQTDREKERKKLWAKFIEVASMNNAGSVSISPGHTPCLLGRLQNLWNELNHALRKIEKLALFSARLVPVVTTWHANAILIQ